ncbi:MAG: 3-oxoacyl-[acyl-carrier-protein] reductase [Chloroflexota bacterium]|nr:3-oxoacyl-[acyl-carrier-protein] reductase [Chloroflexota bacterium]
MGGIQLDGKVALVTGASRGIGAVVAHRLAQAGARVGVNFHSSSDAAEIVVDSINKAGGEAILVGGDVSLEEPAEKVIKDLVDHYGRIDILVNNAGINKDQLLIRMKPEDFDSVMNVNLRGAFLCTRYAMTHMIRQRSGRVINMSSVVGLSGNPGQANYAAAKAGLVGLTKAVAREVASRNVTVNALAPGYITTAMVDELSEETQDKILSTIPMGRFGTPEDVAEAVIFLAGDGASYITGQVLTIDGGMIA